MTRQAVLRDGLELPYVEQGDPEGVPVVPLHGWVDSRRCFERVISGRRPAVLSAVAGSHRVGGKQAKEGR